MGIRRGGLGLVLVLACSALIISLAVAGASDAVPSSASPCSRGFSSTLLETGKVRVYAMAPESTDHPEHQDPAIAGRPVFACLKSQGVSRLLDLPEADDESGSIWVEVDPHHLATRGSFVAYGYTQYYRDTHQTWVRVRSLRNGAIVRNCLLGGGLAPTRLPRITGIVLSLNGEVTWSAEGETRGVDEDLTPGCNATA